MTPKYPKGSEWRKWDLHIHTPVSYDWDKKCKSTNADIIDAVVKAGVSAIAITDHHSVKSIDEMRTLGEKRNIFVIPGVELRTDKGNDKIHIIGLFDPSMSGKTIYDKLLCPLGFSEDDIKKTTDEQIYCNFEKACKKIHELGGLVFLHAGTKSNGIEQLDSDIKATLKTDLASSVDLFEVNSKKSSQDYWSIVFPKIQQSFPCITTSDSVDRRKLTYGGHSTEGIGKAFTWIKADLSFAGLWHILSEPKDRVCLDAEPPKFADLHDNPTKYLEKISINSGSSIASSWFENDIPLNQELVAIIGKKGSGKSALVDIIALCGGSHVPTTHYSFLKPQKFRKNSTIAGKYNATVKWFNAETSSMNLANEVNTATEVERVKYLPQSYVEKICNEDGVSGLFQEEINKVIFSYVPIGKRLGSVTLPELIQKKSEAIDTLVLRVREDIDTCNQRIVVLEEKKTTAHKEKIEKELIEKENEHKSIKDPVLVKEPGNKLSKDQQDKLQKVEDTLVLLEKEILTAEEEQTTTSNALSFIDRLDGQLTNIQTLQGKLVSTFTEEAGLYGINLDEVIQVVLKKKPIEAKKLSFEKKRTILDEKLNKNGKDSKKNLYAKKIELEAERDKVTKSFDEQNQKYREYLIAKKKAEEARSAVMGKSGDKSLKTIFSLKEELSYVDDKLPTDLDSECVERKRLTKELYGAITSRITQYKEIYQPLLDFIETEKAEQERSGNVLTFDAGVVFNKGTLAESFLEFINQGRDGSFQSKDTGSKRLKELLTKYDLQNESDVIKMAEDIQHNLQYDTTKAPETLNIVGKQINQKYNVADVYNFLHQLSYIDVQFKILFNGKDLNENEFSPGEKGALLLIFYLLIDKDKVPLIMDQPEENLDNESVYSLLVPYIKRAKERRQIIIVTHNPNLAVVCDAEQVICASMDKKKNEIRYESGSIEDPIINKKIVDILEGTMPAFSKRDEKYLRSR